MFFSVKHRKYKITWSVSSYWTLIFRIFLPFCVALSVHRRVRYLYLGSGRHGTHNVGCLARVHAQAVLAGAGRQGEYVARFDLLVVFVPPELGRGHADHLTLQGHDTAFREHRAQGLDENRLLERLGNYEHDTQTISGENRAWVILYFHLLPRNNRLLYHPFDVVMFFGSSIHGT